MPQVFENLSLLQNVMSDNQDYYPYGQALSPMNSTSVCSPYSGSSNSQGSGSTTFPTPMSLSPEHMNTDLDLGNFEVLGVPYIEIIEQPVEKFRFRYKSEMIGTHGSLVGASGNSNRRKHAPTVKLHNYADKAIIRCTLVTSGEDQRIPHAHRLVRREGNMDRDDPHHVEVSAETGFTASFHGMGIIHTAKKNIKDELVRKMRMEALEKLRRQDKNATLTTRDEAQIRADAECYQKCVNLNSVSLCFQAFTLPCPGGFMLPLTKPVYSNSINNLKSALTGELKICRIDKHTSSCEGGEEVFIFVEKVGKKNIKIKFFELNEDDREIWSAYGHFTELDVHHQYAIAFSTPPYKDLTITSPKEVFIQLERPSDADCSEPIKFFYKPSDRFMGRKRQRMTCSNSAELTNLISKYNNETLPVDDVIPVLNNDSREISKELTKILSDGCTSAEYSNYINNIDYERYAQLLGQTDEGMLTTDGPSVNSAPMDDAMFAKNILMEAIKSVKTDSKNIRNHLHELLKDRSTYGDTPLHSALRYGQRDIIKYILMLLSTDKDCKALINSQNSSGKTPLHYAVLQNQPEITKALLVLGADPNKLDDHAFSPLHAAVRLPEAGACVDALLSQKIINTEAHNDAGWTPLQLAAEAGSLHAVRSLVHAGANVNNTDMCYGRTALHIAVEGGHKDIVEFLLKETDIEVNKCNFSGNTALHSAVVYPGNRAKELCTLLIQYGADPHIQNHNRDSDGTEKRREQQVIIKEEVDSDQENLDETVGQTSFDLASNKPEILQLLTEPTVQPKTEINPLPTEQEKGDGGTHKTWMVSEHKQKLSTILNKTRGWEKLAKRLKFNYLQRTLQQNTSNPSLLLLNCIDVQANISLVEMENILREEGEEEAADYLAILIVSHWQDPSGSS